ncbi:MAG TPA: Pvc16 family protein [Bacteroidia bacterium]|nr:Pvc16 family protein [Bacteroidia bacterium]
MINEGLEFITTALNGYLRTTFRDSEDKAVLSSLVNADGTVVANIENKIVVCLVNIDQGSNTTNVGFSKTAQADKQSLNMSLEVLFAANFSAGNYAESLKFISTTLSFFQSNLVFQKTNYPNMPQNIDKLELELINLSPEDTNYIWSTLGVKYMPSLMYKVKLMAAN